jgi:hypothetical protein
LSNEEFELKINEDSFLAITTEINAAYENTNDLVPTVDTNPLKDAINQVINTKRTIQLNGSMKDIKIKASGVASGWITLSAFKKGVKNSSYSGPALVSEAGPELIQTKDGAYLTGLNGPELANINKGDTVYTAQETKKILKGSKPSSLPRFEDGKEGRSGTASAYGDGTAYGGAGGKSNSENTLDKLYNLLKEIEAEGRQRERIERRYQYLIESVNSSVTDLLKVSSQELGVLERQRQMQENLRARRRD